MRRVLMILLVLLLLSGTAFASEEETDLTAGLSDEAMELLPESGEQPTDLLESIKEIFFGALQKAFGSIREGIKLCSVLLCILTLCSVLDLADIKRKETVLNIVGALGISVAFLGTARSMISLGVGTAEDISTYGSVLMPALASAAAMSGGISGAASLYAGTVIFTQILLQLITKLLIPLIWFYLAIATAEAAMGNNMLSELREFIGWVITKSLRFLIYIFLAFMTVTGVIGGTNDAAAVKATKAAVSGMIPVVGSILSDASETLLSSAALMKNSVGVLGMLAVLALCLVPLLRVGIQYLLLKVTSAVGGTVGLPSHVKLIKEYSKAMGYLLAMCASSAFLLLIGIVCLMRVA